MNESGSDKNGQTNILSSDKNGEMDKSGYDEEPSILRSMAKVIDAAIETYFQLRETPLPGWARFLFAWLGSATVFVFVSVPIYSYSQIPVKWFSVYIPTGMIMLCLFLAIPAIFAAVIASANTNHGPVRLFLFGIMLTVFIVSLTDKLEDSL